MKEAGAVLVELGLVEQRHRAVLEVLNDGASVTGVEAAVLVKAARIDLADSALHAPAAEPFGIAIRGQGSTAVSSSRGAASW